MFEKYYICCVLDVSPYISLIPLTFLRTLAKVFVRKVLVLSFRRLTVRWYVRMVLLV